MKKPFVRITYIHTNHRIITSGSGHLLGTLRWHVSRTVIPPRAILTHTTSTTATLASLTVQNVCMRACVHVRVCVCACVRACVRACVHTCVHACARAYMYVYVCIRAYVRVCMCVCIVCVCVLCMSVGVLCNNLSSYSISPSTVTCRLDWHTLLIHSKVLHTLLYSLQ